MSAAYRPIALYFNQGLAKQLRDKILLVYPKFAGNDFVRETTKFVADKSYSERIEIFANTLQKYLPPDYQKAVSILLQILGPENKNETGMFKEYYWVLPIGKFVEIYGLDDFTTSMEALAEITKRNTGEYAVRPFIRKYPEKSLEAMKEWAVSENFHLRRLASEGLRPKLPWATKLDIFIDKPQPVFAILELLKEDEIKFVQKSVANHLRDYLKVNPSAAKKLLQKWSKSKNANTQWIVKYAIRKDILQSL